MRQKGLLTLIGFLLFLFGFLALSLSLVGLKLAPLAFIDAGGKGLGFLIRLVMIAGGIFLVVLARTDWEREM